MNRKKLLLIVTGAVFLLTTVFLIGGPVAVGAKEAKGAKAAKPAKEMCSFVTIRGRDNVEPLTLKVKKGDCVLWINFTGGASGTSATQDVIVSFKDGEKCIKATQSPMAFKAEKGCYIAGWLGYGQTSSLIFTIPGTYKYNVEFKPGGMTSGTIIVE